MRLEVYNAPAEIIGDVLRLRLIKSASGCVILEAVDKDGYRVQGGSILEITVGGACWRKCSVNSNLGLCLDEAGRIKLVN
jgi:hypothetical protein